MDKSVKDFFGIVIKQIRKEKKVSQVELALLCDMERGYVSKIERALVQPSITTIYKICDALKVEAAHVIDRVSYLRFLYQEPNAVLRDIHICFDLNDDKNWRNTLIYLNRIFDQWKPIRLVDNNTQGTLYELDLDNIQRVDFFHNVLSVFELKEDELHVVLTMDGTSQVFSDIKSLTPDYSGQQRLTFKISGI